MDRLVWSRSSVPVAMTELEFDLMGAGYAAGYQRALSTFLEQPVRVLVTRHLGHLYSAITAGTQDPPGTLLETSMASWSEFVMPRLAVHFEIFRQLAGERAGPALTEARELFAECVALHHGLLLPARQAILELLDLLCPRDHHAGQGHYDLTLLAAITPLGTPTLCAAEKLVDDDLPEVLGDNELIGLSEDGATDGDGYGLAQPGWLDDGSYPRRMRTFLLRFGVTRSSLKSSGAAAAERQEQAWTYLTQIPPKRLNRELATKLATARVGAALAEVHGPIMHVRYVHELRRLVCAHEERLRGDGQLREPGEIFHLRLPEIDRKKIKPRVLEARRDAYVRSLHRPPPRPSRWTRTLGTQLAPRVVTRLGTLGAAAGRRLDTRTWQGVGAASGCGAGPLKFIKFNSDLDKLEPGDIALVPDAGPAWGWLAVAGVPIIIEHGALLGHAPALARECGVACVVGGTGLKKLVTEGVHVKMSGDTGEVSW